VVFASWVAKKKFFQTFANFANFMLYFDRTKFYYIPKARKGLFAKITLRLWRQNSARALLPLKLCG
jgi:hypothetical protein